MKKFLVFLFAVVTLFGCGPEEVKEEVIEHKQSEQVVVVDEKVDEEKEVVAEVVVNEPIDIIFAGDTMFDKSVKEFVNKNGVDAPFVNVKEEVEKADFAVVNLETSVTHESDKDTSQLFNFKSNPETLQGIKNAGFDMVSLANNHVLDFKLPGFLDTVKHLNDHELKYIGAGMNEEEAYSGQTVEIKGKKIRFMAFSRFIPTGEWFADKDKPGVAEAYTQERVLKAIEKERPNADFIIVYMHWGVERTNQPKEWQRDFAKKMIDTGADAIVGAHPHVLQGFEFYKDKPIAYSIGNFLFPDYVTGKTADTGLLHLTITPEDKIEMRFNPYYIKDNQVIKRDQEYIDAQHAYLNKISYEAQFVGNMVEQKAKEVNN